MSRGALVEAGLVDTMLNIVRHGFGWGLEHRGLIHVVPESGNTFVDECLVEPTPPLPCLCLGEVREDGGARPNRAHEGRAVRILHKVVAGHSGVVRRIADVGLPGDVQVGDDDELELLSRQIFYHPGKVGERLLIYGEGPVFVLKVDIQPKNVGGNAILAQPRGNFPKLRLRKIGVARLLETEGPEWRQRRRSSEPCPSRKRRPLVQGRKAGSSPAVRSVRQRCTGSGRHGQSRNPFARCCPETRPGRVRDSYR